MFAQIDCTQLDNRFIQPGQLWGTRVSCLGVKWPRHEDDHSPSSSTKVKNEWSYTSTLTYAFVACTGTTLHVTKNMCAIGMIIFVTYILTAVLKAVKKQLRRTLRQANSERGESK